MVINLDSMAIDFIYMFLSSNIFSTSILITFPVIHSVLERQKVAIAFATFSGVVSSPCGFTLLVFSIISEFPGIFLNAGVSVTPACMLFAVIFFFSSLYTIEIDLPSFISSSRAQWIDESLKNYITKNTIFINNRIFNNIIYMI